MDEEKFKTHAEKEFWERVYLIAIVNATHVTSVENADEAVASRRSRMTGLIKPGVRAA